MHYKKHKLLHKVHSIPIINNLCKKKRLYLVSYSIPLSCMVALLLASVMFVNPSINDKSYAMEVGEEFISDTAKAEEQDLDKEEVFGDDGIMPLAENPDSPDTTPDISLTISNMDQITQAVQGGDTVYGSYTVDVGGMAISSYGLSIKASSTNLTPPSGTNTTVSGAAGKTGSNMVANTWGYNIVDASTSESSYNNLYYNSLPTADTVIVNNEGATGWIVDLHKKLIFAAKFAENAAPGAYSGAITLSVVATPATTAKWSNGTDSGVNNMQDISAGFCKDNSKIAEGDTIELKDNRDNKTYTIYKAADGNCWMGQNLALTGPKTLASGDTDLASGATWSLPASVGSGGTNTNNINTSNTWDTSNYNVIQIRTGSTSLSGWKNGYGNYYSWPAATAGTGTTSVTSADASASICPKGWKLPTYSGDYSFQTLTNTKSAWTTATYNGNSGVAGYYFGSTKTTLYKGANFWPAAGYVSQSSGALSNAGSNGYYWSRRARPDANNAYLLGFSSSSVYPQYLNGRYYGYSVRCVATY